MQNQDPWKDRQPLSSRILANQRKQKEAEDLWGSPSLLGPNSEAKVDPSQGANTRLKGGQKPSHPEGGFSHWLPVPCSGSCQGLYTQLSSDLVFILSKAPSFHPALCGVKLRQRKMTTWHQSLGSLIWVTVPSLQPWRLQSR